VQAGIKDQTVIETTKRIFRKIDFQLQVRDDFCDAYGDNQNTYAHTGNDIEENRCAWNICKTLEQANSEQKKVLVEHYGKKVPSSVQAVKDVYDQIGLQSIFQTYEKQQYENIMDDIEGLPMEYPKEMFKNMLWITFRTQIKLEESLEFSLSGLRNLTQDIPGFLGIFPELVQDIIKDPDTGSDLSELGPSLSRLLNYNVPHGKKTR